MSWSPTRIAPGGRVLEARHHAQRRRLAAARRAEQREERAGRDREVEVVDRGHRAEALGQPDQVQVLDLTGHHRSAGHRAALSFVWSELRSRAGCGAGAPPRSRVSVADGLLEGLLVLGLLGGVSGHEDLRLSRASRRSGRSAGCRRASGSIFAIASLHALHRGDVLDVRGDRGRVGRVVVVVHAASRRSSWCAAIAGISMLSVHSVPPDSGSAKPKSSPRADDVAGPADDGHDVLVLERGRGSRCPSPDGSGPSRAASGSSVGRGVEVVVGEVRRGPCPARA